MLQERCNTLYITHMYVYPNMVRKCTHGPKKKCVLETCLFARIQIPEHMGNGASHSPCSCVNVL